MPNTSHRGWRWCYIHTLCVFAVTFNGVVTFVTSCFLQGNVLKHVSHRWACLDFASYFRLYRESHGSFVVLTHVKQKVTIPGGVHQIGSTYRSSRQLSAALRSSVSGCGCWTWCLWENGCSNSSVNNRHLFPISVTNWKWSREGRD